MVKIRYWQDLIFCIEMSEFLMQEFDRIYGYGWQCIVGTDFGSFVTHRHGCFIFFGIGSLMILLFKGKPTDENAASISIIGRMREEQNIQIN